MLATADARYPSPAAVAEFLTRDGVHWSRTLVDGIARISYGEIVQLDPAATR